jgi:uncharacterized protein GlcG (DUF336 family)
VIRLARNVIAAAIAVAALFVFVFVSAAFADGDGAQTTVKARDDCDPATFDVAVRPGT